MSVVKISLSDAQVRTLATIMYGADECAIEETNITGVIEVDVDDDQYLINSDGNLSQMQLNGRIEAMGNPGLSLRRPDRSTI